MPEARVRELLPAQGGARAPRALHEAPGQELGPAVREREQQPGEVPALPARCAAQCQQPQGAAERPSQPW